MQLSSFGNNGDILRTRQTCLFDFPGTLFHKNLQGVIMNIRFTNRQCVIRLRDLSFFLLLGSSFFFATILSAGCEPNVGPKNQRLLTQRVLGGGSYIGAWAVLEPNGRTAVFASPKTGAGKTGAGNLYSINIDGTDRKQLTFREIYDGQPAIAPDGKNIAFISEQVGPSKVYLMKPDGSGIRQLTKGAFNDFGPVFARGSSKVFFARRLSGNPDALLDDEIFSIDIDGRNEKRLTRNKLMDTPVAEGRDGATLYYLSGSDRFDLMKLNFQKGTSERVLALGIRGNTGCDISPDEQWVAYVSDSEKPFEYEVFVCHMDGSNRKKLTNFHGYIEQVRFTSDGKQVIFVVQPKEAPGNGRGDIYLASINGKRLRKITAN